MKGARSTAKLKLPALLFALILLFTLSSSAQSLHEISDDTINGTETGHKETKKIKLLVSQNGNIIIEKKDPVLPVEVKAEHGKALSVNVDILKIEKIESIGNRIVTLRHKRERDSSGIIPTLPGKVFYIQFEPADINTLETGDYTAYVLVSAENADSIVEKILFSIHETTSWFTILKEIIPWVRENIITAILYFIETIFFFILIGFIVWFFTLAMKGRHSLNILSIVNETGRGNEIEGVAAGIDDILMNRIQEIAEKSGIAQVKREWLSEASIQEDRKTGLITEAHLQNIMSAGIPMDLQKIGDIHLGPIKIPLGTITSLITKMFGGNYLSGAIQKYGKINKIVMRLEQRPALLSGKSAVRFFEVTWPSEDIRIEDISEGVPHVIDELAYRITLHLAEGIGTKDWNAYRNFLKGILAYRDFEDNRTRKDRLRDAIDFWTGSVRLDQNFAKAHYNLGVASDINEDYESAIFRYQRVIAIDPELVGAESHYNLAMLYWDIYKDENKCLEELEKARALDPELPDIYNLEGLVYSKRRADNKAAETFKKAIQLSGKIPNPIFFYNLSVSCYYLGDYNTAQTAGEQALKIYGEKEKVRGLLQTMGLIHNKKREYEKALQYFRDGLRSEPENQFMLHGYGEALRESGDLECALLTERRLIRLWPEYHAGYAEMVLTLRRLAYPEEEIVPYEKISGLLS